MRLFCPQCLKVIDLGRSAPDREIVSAYCLHPDARFGGGSEIVRMEPVPTPSGGISKSEAVQSGAAMEPSCR